MENLNREVWWKVHGTLSSTWGVGFSIGFVLLLENERRGVQVGYKQTKEGRFRLLQEKRKEVVWFIGKQKEGLSGCYRNKKWKWFLNFYMNEKGKGFLLEQSVGKQGV